MNKYYKKNIFALRLVYHCQNCQAYYFLLQKKKKITSFCHIILFDFHVIWTAGKLGGSEMIKKKFNENLNNKNKNTAVTKTPYICMFMLNLWVYNIRRGNRIHALFVAMVSVLSTYQKLILAFLLLEKFHADNNWNRNGFCFPLLYYILKV